MTRWLPLRVAQRALTLSEAVFSEAQNEGGLVRDAGLSIRDAGVRRLLCALVQLTLRRFLGIQNFARIHQTLRVTPAMEAGVANHVWSVEEIVALLG